MDDATLSRTEEAMTLSAQRERIRALIPSRARREPPRSVPSRAVGTASALALGAFLAFFLDPDAGRRRRHTARDRAFSRVRRSERRAVRGARRVESHTLGMVRRALNMRRTPQEPLDDVALAHKVESELFRRAGAPKGHIDINAEDGAVFLRGVVERDEDVARIGAAAARIPGVRTVENLLHLPGTPAPPSRPKLVRDRENAARDGHAD
jgi:hypothetical protein